MVLGVRIGVVLVGDWLARGRRKISGVMRMFYIFILVVVTHMYEIVKILQASYLKCVHFMQCKWYLIK